MDPHTFRMAPGGTDEPANSASQHTMHRCRVGESRQAAGFGGGGA
jgi:hypothetical protein